jgi:MFS family permease
LRSLAISIAITNFFGSPLFAVIMPVYVSQSSGRATDLGLMVTAFGAGSLLGAIIYGAIGHRLPRRATWVCAFTASTLPFWVLATLPPLPLTLVVLAISGIACAPINPLAVTIRHERIPAELRGRVFSTFSAICQIASPLGVLAAGSLVEGFGVRFTVLAIAVCTQLVCFGMLFVPAFREMDIPAATTPGIAVSEGL